jgi:hypothetical protein
MTGMRCPVFWSRMRYSPGEDRAIFWIRALAVSMVATASHHRTPPDSILKMSREGAIAVHLPFWDTSFLPVMRYPSLSPLAQFAGGSPSADTKDRQIGGSGYWEIVGLRAVEHMKRLKCRFDLTTGTGTLPGFLRLRYDAIWVAPTLMHYISLNLGMREGVSAFRTLYKPLRHLTGT